MPQQNEVGKKKHKVIQIDTEKAFDKIQHYFMIKILSKLRRGTLLHKRASMKNPHVNITLKDERMNASPWLRSGARQRFPLSPLLRHTVV